MIELTEISREIAIKPDAFLSLPIDSRIKSRLKVELDDGREAGLFLPRGHILRGGEQLKSQCGLIIEVKAAPEQVSTVYCSDLHLLTRVAYHLGNRHVPLQVEFGWVRYQHDHVLDEMVEGLGAKVTTEQASFEPESGAYGGRSGGHHHHH
ncbi:urease accessory protein UreE [Vibrio brasiliensis]|jgi:urease accessory protein|uniref:Urease accessory protein UreE n=1 Tax=Vibrio brasiliensis LMG 20546 TaxID=945543 RepID=E8LWX1_9VIBR|nr:urease accessory protein UreE [Vibrio brasiliensis]EGA64872.1 urease accessory protein UreE [Vibrio brasiliensis LMG 20546]MCG9649358.1 urease accessory protein UreE [Vibrio brasiliensis]MCG9725118.1 urease accessory protein UreE [Vibrio brasiliensis]MCG9749505.1 urease accessory protein UreE [Vibrio brasiliensis]MCG9782568.1 urease accessory protein UreE [Vibrio brasiliensis]